MLKSPNRSFNSGYQDFNSGGGGGPGSEMRQGMTSNQYRDGNSPHNLQRDIEEEINAAGGNDEANGGYM